MAFVGSRDDLQTVRSLSGGPFLVAARPALYRAYLLLKTLSNLGQRFRLYKPEPVGLPRLEAELTDLVDEPGHPVLRVLPEGIDGGVGEDSLHASREADTGLDVVLQFLHRLYLVDPVVCP